MNHAYSIFIISVTHMGIKYKVQCLDKIKWNCAEKKLELKRLPWGGIWWCQFGGWICFFLNIGALHKGSWLRTNKRLPKWSLFGTLFFSVCWPICARLPLSEKGNSRNIDHKDRKDFDTGFELPLGRWFLFPSALKFWSKVQCFLSVHTW